MASALLMGTKSEDIGLIAAVENAEAQASRNSQKYFKEIFENYRRANGKIYNSEDLEKLNLQKRPAFVYNLFRPILLQLAGNFRQNIGKIELYPKTPDDIEMTNILNDLVDHAMFTANNFETEITKAYINAIIGRVGWIYSDYRYDIDEKGMFWFETYNPFRILFDSEKGTSNTKRWNYIIDRGYYTPEEIKNLFALDDNDMYNEITEKSKTLLGDSKIRNKQIISMIERVWGIDSSYAGRETGYDAYSSAFNSLQRSGSEYLDYDSNKFKVIDFHERRSETIHTAYIPSLNKEFDITESIDRLTNKANKQSTDYSNAIAQFRDGLIQKGFNDVIIKRKYITQIHQTAVCPALNMVLSDEPYKVQNNNFKLIPTFCFEMDHEVLEWKSYIDDLIDPVRGLNLSMNTMQTYLMKTAQGETWYEEDALVEYEDDFINSSINAYKKVKKGKIDKIKRINPPALPPGYTQLTSILEEMTKKISTIRDNAVGTKEQANESGRLFNARVAQTDLLQLIPQDNAINQLKILGENCIDNLIYYLTPDRVFRIVGNQQDPYWIQINKDSIDKLFYKGTQLVSKERINRKISESKYDVGISRVPFGEAAKSKEFEQMVMISKVFLEMGRPDLIMPELILEISNLRTKETWKTFVTQQMKNQLQITEAQKVEIDNEKKLSEIERIGKIEKNIFELNDKRKEAGIDQIIEGTLSNIVNL